MPKQKEGFVYRVTVGLKDMGEFGGFREAFWVFFKKIMEAVDAGTTHQRLETTNFITYTDHVYGVSIPMDFFQVKDLAYDVGLLKDGKL